MRVSLNTLQDHARTTAVPQFNIQNSSFKITYFDNNILP